MKLCHKSMLAAIAASLLLLFTATARGQSIEDNIRPVGQVCLAGQDCADTVPGAASDAGDVAAAPREPEPAAVDSATDDVVEPAAAAGAVAPAFDAAAAYQRTCFACHGTGAAGAPKLGDREAWSARIEKGMDAVMTNVNNGLNAMPPKGLCVDCSESDLRAAVDYMLAQ